MSFYCIIQANAGKLGDISLIFASPLPFYYCFILPLSLDASFVGIKQVVFGGEEYENWNENMTSEDSGFSVHKI
ncbi:hypothetical protein Ahy_A06g030423 isoform D [Arachis hypogaea]|uniref:Uncharacterized protein n=1 Tax=Arachis hypogaea TaxID=3818 RepID=A0A445CW75_ARAHY|nr:hypothetical protein Ahy_A06g030423 isoform D [Arachis hypogaea]